MGRWQLWWWSLEPSKCIKASTALSVAAVVSSNIWNNVPFLISSLFAGPSWHMCRTPCTQKPRKSICIQNDFSPLLLCLTDFPTIPSSTFPLTCPCGGDKRGKKKKGNRPIDEERQKQRIKHERRGSTHGHERILVTCFFWESEGTRKKSPKDVRWRTSLLGAAEKTVFCNMWLLVLSLFYLSPQNLLTLKINLQVVQVPAFLPSLQSSTHIHRLAFFQLFLCLFTPFFFFFLLYFVRYKLCGRSGKYEPLLISAMYNYSVSFEY